MPEQTLFTMSTAVEAGDLPSEPTVDHEFSTSTRLQLDDTSWIDYVPGWLAYNEVLMRSLVEEASWEQRSRWMFTRMVEEPRLTAEYPSLDSAPQPAVHVIAAALSEHYESDFKRLWMNWYRDERDGTGWHADRPASKQETAVIPVLSLGASRRFLVRPCVGGASRTFTVHGGDLIVMGGRCQRDYQHSVPKQKRPAGPRLSLNFSAGSSG